ncbi:hypothetical protein CFK37_06555 [Virgibacillus phasianinus]|uniref:Uncharacterized protein n=1 Tax=Virgibacillus phasianinus TaxID=2017483 RepID=A0A220U242_9BACI|nr:hypothetical protein [Virgibacillus phasianinus]ASK61843.1 hypothetical protein CFK37_06555 [Virgibacillus phasianinus]
MGKSNARKKREKRIREGRPDPVNSRSPFARLDLRTKMTKTKKDILYQNKHKNRNPKQRENDSFYYGTVSSALSALNSQLSIFQSSIYPQKLVDY